MHQTIIFMQTLYIILPPRRDAPPCVLKIMHLENHACIYSHTAVWLYERCRPYHISAFFMHQTIIFMQTLYIIFPPRRDAPPCVLKIVRLEKTRLENHASSKNTSKKTSKTFCDVKRMSYICLLIEDCRKIFRRGNLNSLITT